MSKELQYLVEQMIREVESLNPDWLEIGSGKMAQMKYLAKEIRKEQRNGRQ